MPVSRSSTPLTRMTAGTAHSLSDMLQSTDPSAQIHQEPCVPRVKIMRTRTRRWAERPGTRPKVRLLSSIPPRPRGRTKRIITALNATMRASRDRPAPIRNHESRRHPNLVGKKTKPADQRNSTKTPHTNTGNQNEIPLQMGHRPSISPIDSPLRKTHETTNKATSARGSRGQLLSVGGTIGRDP